MDIADDDEGHDDTLSLQDDFEAIDELSDCTALPYSSLSELSHHTRKPLDTALLNTSDTDQVNKLHCALFIELIMSTVITGRNGGYGNG